MAERCETGLDHEWVVFSTCLGDCSLMCQCAQCAAFGVVKNPTKEEWCRAGGAPSNPYRWDDASRVQFIKDLGKGERYIEHPNAN